MEDDYTEREQDYFPPPIDYIVELIGEENALKLAKEFSGQQIYFPKYESVTRPLTYRKIREEFNGFNFKYLAKKYGFSEMGIRKIVADDILKKQNEPLPGQVSIDDIF